MKYKRFSFSVSTIRVFCGLPAKFLTVSTLWIEPPIAPRSMLKKSSGEAHREQSFETNRVLEMGLVSVIADD